MKKFFNTAGPVKPGDHYALDPAKRIDIESVLLLIEQQKYFILHAPRQTGKTSLLLALRDYLNAGDRYRCVYMNVEAAQAARSNIPLALKAICSEFISRLSEVDSTIETASWIKDAVERSGEAGALSDLLTRWTQSSQLSVILLIDEIDALVGDVLISVLRQIRSGYDKRPASFPQSIVLCGVRDIRDYRIKQEGLDVITGGSAFNIKAESLRLGDFSRDDVFELIQQHTTETGQQFEPDAIERIWYLTQGQPWLVNALAYETCFRMKENLDRSRLINVTMIDNAKEAIIKRRETHIDQLTDKLKEERVHRVIAPMLKGGDFEQDVTLDNRQYLIDLGLIKETSSGLQISNPIYKEIIPRELTSLTEENLAPRLDRAVYIAPDGSLNIKTLLEMFQQFFRENSEIWLERFDYKEAAPQLLLQAYLQRIVNGGGVIEREYGLGRGRTDLYIKWPLPNGKKQRFVFELKILRKSLEATIAEGLKQTVPYADTCNADEAHLIIFDRSPEKSWDEKIWRRAELVGKRTIGVWGM